MSSFLNISANTAATVVAKTAAKLRTVTINTKGSASNQLVLYDNASAASGTKIGTFDTTVQPGYIEFCGLQTVNGLVAVLQTGGAADKTIVWD